VQAQLSYFKLCKEVYAKVGLRQLDCDECVFVKYSQNIKGQPPLSVENIIESGSFMTMDTVPKDQRVYKSCIYPVACIIIVMYVDNNGVRHNCHELLAEFQSDVAKDGRIDLHLWRSKNPAKQKTVQFFPFYFLLHKRAKPAPPLVFLVTHTRELKPYTPSRAVSSTMLLMRTDSSYRCALFSNIPKQSCTNKEQAFIQLFTISPKLSNADVTIDTRGCQSGD
jgi:hypothetical protein